LRAGAKGCVTKAEGIQGVLAALRKVIKGEIYLTKRFSEWLLFQAIQAGGETGTPIDRLTDRELEILYLLGRGLGTQQMAQELHLGVKTIETHRGNIRKKLGFQDVREMIRFAIDWVEQEGAT
jgi:DNA-binding NarL/FixJ family response regulator